MTFGKIGARKMMNTAWINPYVKDGLVAMWDGIWNVGGGQTHDNSSKIWWDCIGGKPIILRSDASVFSSNGVPQSLLSDMSEQLCGLSLGSSETYGWRFAEFVVTLGQDITTNTPYIFTIGKRTLWCNFSEQNIGVTSFGDSTWHASSSFAKGDTISVSVDYSSAGTSEKGSAVWFNSVSLEHTGVGDSWLNAYYVPYAISNFYRPNTSYSFSGTYHAIRLYNRALTQTEIDANYAVDVQRFNLNGGGLNV